MLYCVALCCVVLCWKYDGVSAAVCKDLFQKKTSQFKNHVDAEIQKHTFSSFS